MYEKRDGIAYITFNRPQVRNALSPEVFCRLVDAWKDYATDDSVRVAIITGTGERAFTAGADLGTFIPLLTGARQPEDAWDQRVLEDSQISDVAILRGFTLYKPMTRAFGLRTRTLSWSWPPKTPKKARARLSRNANPAMWVDRNTRGQRQQTPRLRADREIPIL